MENTDGVQESHPGVHEIEAEPSFKQTMTYTVKADFDHPPDGSFVHEDVRKEVENILQSCSSDNYATIAPTLHTNRHNVESAEEIQQAAFAAFTQESPTSHLVALISKLENPGTSSAIDGLPPDTYICDLVVQYNCGGAESRFTIRRAY